MNIIRTFQPQNREKISTHSNGKQKFRGSNKKTNVYSSSVTFMVNECLRKPRFVGIQLFMAPYIFLTVIVVIFYFYTSWNSLDYL